MPCGGGRGGWLIAARATMTSLHATRDQMTLDPAIT